MKTMIMMINFILVFLLSLILTPTAIKMCILDRPNSRKIHDRPIPKGGGIGIFIPVIIAELMMVLFFKSTVTLDAYQYFTVMFVTLILMGEGLIDDKLELGAKVKLCIQMIAAILTLSSGLRFQLFGLAALDILLTCGWIIGIINAVNLIDGLDGLAAGVAAISAVGFGVIGYAYGLKTLTMLSLIIIGGCLGFLPYNFRPARIFMGDTGSVPLGYHLAILGILCENGIKGKASVIIPVIMVGIPVFDTLLTIARRISKRKPIFRPDRSHFYNLMIDLKGAGHKNTVLIIYSIHGCLVMISGVLAFSYVLWRIAVLCILIAAAYVLTNRMGFMEADRELVSENASSED